MPKLVSVIVEWENAKLSDLDRAERMLAQLGRQMAEVARKRALEAELLVLYDSDEIDPAVPRAALSSHRKSTGPSGPGPSRSCRRRASATTSRKTPARSWRGERS
jgi:hypothetical protein